MSTPLSRLQAVVLGFIVFLALGLGTLGLFAIGSRRVLGSDAFHVTAGFGDIAGVEVGTRVRVQGMDAGEVEAIVPPESPGQPVKLRLLVAGKYRHLVRSDARVQISGEGLLPGRVVCIVPGLPDATPLADGGELTTLPSAELAQEVAQASRKLNEILGEVKLVVADFQKGNVAQELATATTRLNKVLLRADDTLQTVQRGEGTLGKLLKDDRLYADLTTTLAQVNGALDEVRSGKGTLGQLVKSNEAYSDAMQSLAEVRQMVVSVKQNADAFKALPIVRSYVVDPNKELIRPHCTRLRKWFAEKDLFEPGRAVLTQHGRYVLDNVAPWLKDQKQEGSEVVVAAFASPDQNAEFAKTLTEQQSRAAADYLKANHKVQRTGFWWWSNRPVRPVGCGIHPPPVPETERLPSARLEILVFVPENS